MGSVLPKARITYSTDLLVELARLADEVSGPQDPPIALGADLIDRALANPSTRRATLLGLSAFVLEALSGLSPDPRINPRPGKH